MLQHVQQRQNDIYVFCVSSSHCVAAEGKYIAFVSTITQRSDIAQADGTINAKVAGTLRTLGCSLPLAHPAPLLASLTSSVPPSSI